VIPAFTGDLVEGDEAAEMGLVWEAVTGDELDDRVDALAERDSGDLFET
jgi:enoyl-CoA hydratase/carnithine racemase